MMNDKQQKFNRYEYLIFRIHMSILGFGFVLLGLMFVFNSYIKEIANVVSSIVVVLFFSTFVSFFIAIGRIIRYLRHYKNVEGMVGIKRTVSVLLTSPISFGIYFIIMLGVSLALSSCTYNG